MKTGDVNELQIAEAEYRELSKKAGDIREQITQLEGQIKARQKALGDAVLE